ncbi:MAG: hypothetical protein NVSMB19_02360 [Vulcanimicrobiaceae bacterium]
MKLGRTAGIALVTSPLVASAYGATLLAGSAPAQFAADFAQPLVVVTAWGAYGIAAFAWLAGGIAASAILLGVALARIAHRPRPDDRYGIYAGAVLGLCGAAAWPFVFSSDVYAYAAYGSLAERGFDPYRLAPATLNDAFLAAARWQWHGPVPVDVYGPGMLAISRAAVRLTGASGVAATLSTLRLWAAGAFLTSIALLDVALAAAPHPRRSLVLAAYALNPVVLWSVAEGHNDAFVAAGCAAAAALAARGRGRFGGLLAGLLPALKITGAFFTLGFALEALRGGRRPGRAAVAATVAGLALAALVALPPLLTALAAARTHGRYEPTVSAQGLLGPGPALALAFAALGWGMRRLAAGESRGYAWLGIAALLCLPNVYPWYALWVIPAALAAGGGPAATGLWIATIFAIVRYLPDASGTLTERAASLAAVVAIAPFAIALAEFGPHARAKKVPVST